MSSTNRAAFLTGPDAQPLSIGPSPMPTPGPNDIVVHAKAYAINPLEVKMQQHALFPITYPMVPGNDVTGTVQAVGSNVTRFAPGDRAAGQGRSFLTREDADGAFQEYARLDASFAVHVPERMPWTSGVVLPTAMTTSAAGLFAADILALRIPSPNERPPLHSAGKTVLVWGGASSVGTSVIQLAHLAGARVVATCSPRNAELCRSLGADHVVDYNAPTAIDDVVDLLRDADVPGAYDAIGGAATGQCAAVLARLPNAGKTVGTTLPPPPEVPDAKPVWSPAFMPSEDGAKFLAWMQSLLDEGVFKAAPETQVVGKGLESLQGAMDLLARGVSAKKIVVEA